MNKHYVVINRDTQRPILLHRVGNDILDIENILVFSSKERAESAIINSEDRDRLELCPIDNSHDLYYKYRLTGFKRRWLERMLDDTIATEKLIADQIRKQVEDRVSAAT